MELETGYRFVRSPARALTRPVTAFRDWLQTAVGRTRCYGQWADQSTYLRTTELADRSAAQFLEICSMG